MSPIKKPSGIVRRLGLSGAVYFGSCRLVIRLQDRRLIRLFARSVLFAAAVFSFSCLRSAVLRYGDADRTFDEGVNFEPSLLEFLGRRGLLQADENDFFLRDPIANGAKVVPSDLSASVGDLEGDDLDSVRSGRNPSESFQALENDGDTRLRRLLSVPVKKKDALKGLEEVLLEPPGPGRRGWQRKARYLPELTGDALDEYPRRVFVEVAPAGAGGSVAVWFEQNYPTKGRTFEVIRVEVKEEAEAEVKAQAGTPSLAEWLERNVKEDEYVVVKAEATAMEEVVGEGAIGLVDEMFLECDHQTEEGEEEKVRNSGRRAYWECLALYGKLRDAGVAVHQWWN